MVSAVCFLPHVIFTQPFAFLGLRAQSPFPELSLMLELLPMASQATFEALSEDRGLKQGREGRTGGATRSGGSAGKTLRPRWKQLEMPWGLFTARSNPPPQRPGYFDMPRSWESTGTLACSSGRNHRLLLPLWLGQTLNWPTRERAWGRHRSLRERAEVWGFHLF